MSGIINKAGVGSAVIGKTQALVTAAGESGGGGGGISTFDATADGALANGDRVILQANGKVKVVGQAAGTGVETITSDNQAQSLGARWEEPSLHYDPNDITKFAIMHRHPSTNQYTMRIGTITGTTIAFGTDQTVDSTNTNGGHSFQWHPKIANMVVCTYGLGSGSGGWKIKVGIVSGTTVNFSGKWDTAIDSSMDYDQSSYFSIDCDPSASTTDQNTFVAIAHYNNPGGMDDYRLKEVAGYISDDGTTGTIGTVHQRLGGDMAMGFNSRQHHVRFDPATEGKYAFFYDDYNQGNAPIVRLNTVSGTTITQNGENNADPGNGGDSGKKQVEWITGGGKVILSWRKQYYPSLIIGTVSGTSISYGSILQVDSSQNPSWDIYITSNSSTRVYAVGKTAGGTGPIIGKVIDVSGTTMTEGNTSDIMTGIAGGINQGFGSFDGSNKIMVRGLQGNNASDYTKFTSATIGQAGATNLAAGNFIGISDGAYADGVTATIQLSSPSIDDAQSGLTPGSSYYVQNDGSLSTTAGSPAVLAGIALSATQLLIKG